MPSSKRQRELARRRAERQAQRRAAARAARRRRNAAIVGGTFVTVLLVVLGIAFADDFFGDDAADPQASPSASPEPAVACGGTRPPAVKQQSFAKEPAMSIDKAKTYTATMQTSCGTIRIELFDDKAPRTVNSLKFLADKNYYDGSFCHRMTTSPTLTVLQCGDPQGTGGGGPGYTLAEENLEGAKYPRGYVAMAKTQEPNTTGSQFFLIGKDSGLPPEYTVVGRMDEASLKVLDKILALGIEPAGSTDGAPKQRVYVTDFTVAAK